MKPHGSITITDPRGYAYLPQTVRDELGIPRNERREIPYLLNTGCVLLFHPEIKSENLVESLEILIKTVKHRGDKNGSSTRN